MSKYCCIFNHYNPTQTVNAYVFLLLDYFSSIGCETIVVSNSKIEGIELKELISKRSKERWLERKNKGDDFDSWQYGLEKGGVQEDTQYLFLLNDSIFGPLTPLDPIVQKMLGDESADFWGLTDSYQGGWHLQTYFLCCKRNVFSSEAFQLFFKQNVAPPDANDENNNRAVFWTKTLTDAGFKGKAYVDYNILLRHNHEFSTYRDPILYYPERLIRNFQFPFIKREFILNNPENIEIPEGILGMLNQHTTYPVEYILESIINRYVIETISKPEFPLIDVICHLFYLHSAYDFLSALSHLKKYNCRFFFNLSDNLYADPYFIKVLTASFKDCILVHTSNKGKDLGGKLAVIDLTLGFQKKSDYTILLHDKHSPHTSLGKIWKKKLFRIIEPNHIEKIVHTFASKKQVGIVSAGEFIKNEYDSSTHEFDCTCSQILKRLIQHYQLTNTNFDFVGGTMFWVRSDILRNFFTKHSALDIRATFEKGNVLDNNQGTETHAWERMLSWIAIDQGYTLTGINE